MVLILTAGTARAWQPPQSPVSSIWLGVEQFPSLAPGVSPPYLSDGKPVMVPRFVQQLKRYQFIYFDNKFSKYHVKRDIISEEQKIGAPE